MTQHNIAFLTAGIFVGLLVGVAVTLVLSSSSKSSETMKLEFGIRMTREDGVSIFGVDEIQARLEDGAAITALQCTGAKFQKTGEDDENVSLYFSGGGFEVELTDGDPSDAEGD